MWFSFSFVDYVSLTFVVGTLTDLGRLSFGSCYRSDGVDNFSLENVDSKRRKGTPTLVGRIVKVGTPR